MSQQQSYANQTLGFPGQRMGSNHEAGSFINDLGSSRQTIDVTITAVNSTAYSLTINGIAVNYTSDGTATAAEIRDGLIVAGRALPELEGIVIFNPFGALLRILAAVPGTAFTYADTGNLTESTTVANVAPVEIPFGRAVIKRTGTGTTEQSARLPTAPTAQVTTVTVATATNSKVYSFIILADGYSYQIDYTADGSATTAEISAGLTARVNALNIPVTAADTTDELTLTSDVPGQPFTVMEVDAELTVAETTANVSLMFLGVAERNHNVVDAQNASDGVGKFKVFTAIEEGDVVVEVEEAVAYGDPAYFRHTASGANTALGKWRNDADSATCNLVSGGVLVYATSSAGLSVLRLK